MPLFCNDRELLLAFREGRPETLEVVYRHYVRSVETYLRTLARVAGARDLAQPSAIADLLQEVFIRAFSPTARRAYDGLRDFAPYLNAIARNCFVDTIRKRRKEVLVGLDDLPTSVDPDHADDAYDPKIVAVLETYLRELPPPLRGVYEQRFVHGRSQEAACENLGISRRTLRTTEDHLRRGLRKALLLAGMLHRDSTFVVASLNASRP